MYQISFGSRIRKSPFFDATVQAGVTRFSIYNHMYMPTGYGDPEAEYWRLINDVAMWDVAVERQVELHGPDAGRLLNDPVLLKLAEDRYWLSLADGDILLWARAIAAERGLRVEVFEPDAAPLAIQGPKAQAVVRDLFGDWITQIRFFGFRHTELDGIPLLLARSGWSKQGGFELYLCDGARGTQLWDKVYEAGQPYGIGPGNPNPQERVESALLSYRADTDDDTNPLEVGLQRYLDLDTAIEYIGKTALQDIARQGPRRRQVGLLLDDQPLAACEQPWPVLREGQSVGWISAAVWSPRLQRNIALALVQSDAAAPGAGLEIASPERDLEAEVTSLPFL